jgi:hypothetical protein
MGDVRAIDGRYSVALGEGQTGRFHGFQLAMRGGEADATRASECADGLLRGGGRFLLDISQ